jgi:hypothetical protein
MPDSQDTREERLGLVVTALPAVDVWEIVQSLNDIHVIGYERLFSNRERAREQRLRLCIAPLQTVEDSERPSQVHAFTC